MMSDDEPLGFPICCGYCLESCFEDEVHQHVCLQIFKEFFIEESYEHFWGSDGSVGIYELSDEQREQIELLKGSKENRPNNTERQIEKEQPKKKTAAEKSADAVKIKIDQEEQLILEVQTRPPLWNFTLPIEERSRSIRKKLWIEVSDAMKGSFTSEGARKKFKSLVDTFRSIIRSEKCPSGAARKSNSGSKWPHYHAMEFMRDHLSPRKTLSNCAVDDGLDSSDSLENMTNLSCSRSKRPRKQKHSSTDSEMLCQSFDKVAEAISASSNSQIILPPPPEMTEIDACLVVIGNRLKKIQTNHLSEATQDLLTYSMEVLRRYTNL